MGEVRLRTALKTITDQREDDGSEDTPTLAGARPAGEQPQLVCERRESSLTTVRRLRLQQGRRVPVGVLLAGGGDSLQRKHIPGPFEGPLPAQVGGAASAQCREFQICRRLPRHRPRTEVFTSCHHHPARGGLQAKPAVFQLIWVEGTFKYASVKHQPPDITMVLAQ